MGLKEFYLGVEDKYYSFLDKVDHAGFPIYKVVDAIEGQNIPSFPIAIAVSLIILIGIVGLFNPALIGLGNTRLTVTVLDETQTPLKGISVHVTGDGLSGDALSTRLTDSDGRVTFSGLSAGTTISVIGEADDVSILSKKIVIDSGENTLDLLATLTNAPKNVSIQLYKTNSTENYLSGVSLTFNCSAGTYTQTKDITGGQTTLNVPGDCGTLTVQSSNPNVTLGTSVIDLESNTPAIYLNSTPAGNGIVRVTLYDNAGKEIAGTTVTLKSKFGDVLAQKFTNATGFVEFTGIVPDTYVLFVPSDGIHAETESESFEVSDSVPVEKALTVNPASVGEVRLQLVDEGTLSAVAGASVTLSRGTQVVSTKTTNEGGQVTFSVSTTANLTVGIDHPSYLIKGAVPVTVSSSGYAQVPLVKATPQNSQIVTVHVVDELNQPVENAYVTLKKSPAGTSVGTNTITGASGTVVFTSLEEGTYFASAYKPGFSDQLRSDTFAVKARENVEITVKLVLGTGNVRVTVVSTENQPLAGASIQPIDGITHEPIGSELATDVAGTKDITLRADKYVYFLVTEPNHQPFITLPVQMKKGITLPLHAEMVKDIQKLEVKPLGTFVNGSPVLEESGLTPGQTYTVRFGLYVPANSVFDEVGVHLRTGTSADGQTNPVENDDWLIRNVRGAFSKLQKGTTFSPPAGLGIDSQHVTSADAKWANVVFTPMREGLTIIEADLLVKDTAVQGADLPLYYRAWGRTGSYVRFPVDAVLGGSESTGQKQSLYANANLKLFSTGTGTQLCNKDFCLGFVAEDLANGLQTPLTSQYDADISTKHKLLFTMTSVSDSVLQDTSLVIKSTTSAGTLGTYEVTNAVGVKKTGTITGNTAELPIGVIQKNNVVFGFVNVDALKEGTSKISVSVVSNKKELYTRDLLIKVNAAGVLSVTINPKVILPLLTNQMLVRITQTNDNIPLENASVTLSLNDTLLTSGYTDIEGVFPFELNEPNVGDTVLVHAEKAGYKPVDVKLTVGEDIVDFVPQKLAETLVVNGAVKKTRDIRLVNVSSIPLTIDDVSLSGSFSEYVKFDLVSTEILDQVIGVNQDQNITFALSLTDKGQQLLVPKTIGGSVLVKLTNETTGKTFTSTLPLTMKIGFGGEVDVEDCLLVEPLKWDIFSDPKETTQQSFAIKNACTVKGSAVKLFNLSAKIKQLAGDNVGTFTATTDSQVVELVPAFKTILTEIPAKGEVVVTVSFTPAQINSGVAMPQLVFQAENPTDAGVPDLLSETVSINANVNKLSSCVQVKTPVKLEIESCPINTAGGNYNNYFNQVYRPTGVPYYNPSYSVLNNTTNPSGSSLLPSSVSGYTAGFSGYGSPYGVGTNTGYYGQGGYDGFGNYSANPYSPLTGNGYSQLQGPYANPYYDSYNYSQGAGTQYGCGFTEFRVENTCQSEVEVTLDTSPNLFLNGNAFVLKPNQSQQVVVQSGYKIGIYPVSVNARTNGSQNASQDIELLNILVKSPTEVNGDCIQLDKTKFRFNQIIQKPVTGKVINRCYSQGVRLVESADTIKIASFFNADGGVSLTGENATQQQPNTMVNDIQVTGIQTRGEGSDTVQELEFQIFPDLTIYNDVPNLLGQTGGLGKKLSDIKLFAELGYYRIESYGTISVRYLDAYSAAQQKPFPVIFENAFNALEFIDPLLQGGSTRITDYSECVNKNVFQDLVFGDDDFKGQTVAYRRTAAPNSVLKTGAELCGTSDKIGEVTGTTTFKGNENNLVQATFRKVDDHDIQVTITRPQNLAQDTTITGMLNTSVTRVFTNTGTQNVQIPISIKVLKSGTSSSASLAPLTCGAGYEKGTFNETYGFDLLNWDWSFDGAPDCTSQSGEFCDGTQLLIHATKNIGSFNKFIEANQDQGLFKNATKTYSTENFLNDVVVTANIVDGANVGGTNYYLDNSGLPLQTNDADQLSVLTDQFSSIKSLVASNNATPDWAGYASNMSTILNNLKTTHPDIYEHGIIILENEGTNKLDGLVPASVKAIFIDPLTVKGITSTSNYSVWTFSEFHAFQKAIKGSASQTEVQYQGYTIRPEYLNKLYNSIYAVRIGLPVQTLGNSAEDRAKWNYILKNTKKVSGFTYSDFGDADGLLDQLFSSRIRLIADKYPDSLKTDFLKVNNPEYLYKSNVNKLGIDDDTFNAIVFNKDAKTARPSVEKAGEYGYQLFGEWTSTSKLSNIQLRIADEGFLPLTNLNNGTATHYERNPFFNIPFDGYLGKDGNKRNGYGVPYLIGLEGDIQSVGVTPTTAEITVDDLAQLRANANGKPVMFSLNTSGGIPTIVEAPNYPIPFKLTYGSAQGLPVYQYAITDSTGSKLQSFASSPITWYDCADGFANPLSDKELGGATTIACQSNRKGDRVFSSTTTGEFTYRGIMQVPVKQIDAFAITPICANEKATLEVKSGNANVTKTPLPNPAVILPNNIIPDKAKNPPKTLTEMLAAVQSGTACGKIAEDSFTIIWDLETILPANLTCANK